MSSSLCATLWLYLLLGDLCVETLLALVTASVSEHADWHQAASARLKCDCLALRLQASLKPEAERLAKAEGTTLNQFINVAVAEKIAALRTADFFRERARRADVSEANCGS